MWVKVTTLSFQCRDKLNFTTMPENVPNYAHIMLDACKALLCSKLCWHNPPKPSTRTRSREYSKTHALTPERMNEIHAQWTR